MNNLFCFHGIDHKVGTTMTAQSVAEIIASGNPEVSVLFTVLNGSKNCQYFKSDVKKIDDYKLQIDSKILHGKDFKRECQYDKNLYVLGGLSNEQEERYYFPDSAKYLLEAVGGGFDIIIADTGSRLDNGPAFGALINSGASYLIMTQHESSLKSWEEKKQWFEKAQIDFDHVLINKFREEDPYTCKYISDRLYLPAENIVKVADTKEERKAESEHRTFVDMRDTTYTEALTAVANEILQKAGHKQITPQKRRITWRSFI